MSHSKFIRAIPEHVYEADKILRVEPHRLILLGLYTLRVMLPPGSKDYALETPAAIRSTERVEEDKWNVDFTTYDPDNSGEINNSIGLFTDDGHMFIDNVRPSFMSQFGPKILMGYFVGSLEKEPLMIDVFEEVPEKLKNLDLQTSGLISV